VFPSYGRGCNSEVVQAVVRFVNPTPLRNTHPTGTAKGCRDAARDILVVALAGHNRSRNVLRNSKWKVIRPLRGTGPTVEMDTSLNTRVHPPIIQYTSATTSYSHGIHTKLH